MTNDNAGTTLRSQLQAGRFVMTAEIVPPVSIDPGELIAKAMPLKHLADAVNLTDGAGARAHTSALVAASLLLRHGIEPVLQLTCRDRNRIALQGDLLGAAASGIRNLLILTGDDPKAGDQPDTKPVFDLDSRALIETAHAMGERGTLPSGRAISGGKPDFFIGAADMPIDPPAKWKPTSLAAKIAAGARFAQTQFCMDAGVVRRYVGRLRDEGIGNDIANGLAILIGVTPLRSAKSARWMKANLFGTIIPDSTIEQLEQAADPAETGRRLTIALIEELASIPGVAGIHVMAPGNETALAGFLRDARRALPRERQSAAAHDAAAQEPPAAKS